MRKSIHNLLVMAVSTVLLVSTATADKIDRISPKKAGFDSKRLALIEKKLQSYIDQGRTGGFVAAIANKDKVVYLEAFGYQDIANKQAMTEDSLFRIFSMSKPMTSVALMMLYEEGKFHLNDPIAKYMPEFADLKVMVSHDGDGMVLEDPHHAPTIRELMTHTAGFTYGVFGNTPVDKLYQEARLATDNTRSLAEFTQALAKIPLLHQPGTRWNYGLEHDVQGRLIEVLSGQPFDEFMQERLFKPLKMTDTAFYAPASKIDRFATAYTVDPKTGKLVIYDPAAGGLFSKEPTLPSGGGGLVSSTKDYLRFGQMLMNNGTLDGERILGRKTLELMTMNHISHLRNDASVAGGSGVSTETFGYGLGFGVDLHVPSTGAPGTGGSDFWGGFASTIFWIDPKEEVMGLLMTQLVPSNILPLREDFKVLTYGAMK